MFAWCVHGASATLSRTKQLTTPIVFQQFHPQEHQNAYETNCFPLPYWGNPKLRCPDCIMFALCAAVRSRPSPTPRSLQNQWFANNATLISSKTNCFPTNPPSGTPQCLQNQWFPLPYWGISKLRCHKVGSTRTEISCWPKGVMPAWCWFSVWI